MSDNIIMKWIVKMAPKLNKTSITVLAEKFNSDFPSHKISRSKFYELITEFCGLVYGKSKIVATHLTTSQSKRSRLALLYKIQDSMSKGRSIIYIDETYYRRVNSKGKRWDVSKFAHSDSVADVTKHTLTLTLAASADGFIFFKLDKGTNGQDKFLIFLKELKNELDKRLMLDPYIYLDNVGFHRTDLIIDYLRAQKISTIYGPKYYCYFSLVEYVFGLLKRKHYKRIIKTESSFN